MEPLTSVPFLGNLNKMENLALDDCFNPFNLFVT